MLRLLVVLLLLANIGFFAWSQWIAPRQVTAAPAAAPAARKLVLAADTGQAETTPTDAPVAASCLSIGPFIDVGDVARASTSLRNLGMAPRQRAAAGPVWAGFWVAIENVTTRAAADDIVARLRQFGVTDAYVIDGPEPVTISLGLYTEEQRALRRLDEVKAQGYGAVMSTRERAGTVYWIDVNHEPGEPGIDTTLFQSESGRILRLEVKPCGPEAATSQPVADAGAPPGVPG
jgi:hypothetical protein